MYRIFYNEFAAIRNFRVIKTPRGIFLDFTANDILRAMPYEKFARIVRAHGSRVPARDDFGRTIGKVVYCARQHFPGLDVHPMIVPHHLACALVRLVSRETSWEYS